MRSPGENLASREEREEEEKSTDSLFCSKKNLSLGRHKLSKKKLTKMRTKNLEKIFVGGGST